MKDLLDILNELGASDKQAFLDIMAYCDKRVTADEGIPTIIALDDLTRPEESSFAPAHADRDMNLILAMAVLLYTNLYENKEQKDPDYPAICPAMSAAAEMCFYAEYNADGSDLRLVPYSEVVGDFIKKPAAEQEA